MTGDTTMRAVLFDRFGGPDVLRIAEVERPRPGPGEVLVRMAAASVNPADWKTRAGWLSFFELPLPFVGGFDGAGRIAALGEGVAGLAAGDRVVVMSNMSVGRWGAFAEYACCPAATVAALPEGVDPIAAATLPVAGLTAWQALFDNGGLQRGESVLVNGGAGGTGSFAVQLARMTGARVAATCGPANLDYVRALGAERAIDYRNEDVAAVVAAFAPGGVDLLLDTVGDGSLADAPGLVRPGGRLLLIETLIADERLPDPERAAGRRVAIVRSSVVQANIGRQLAGLAEALHAGRIRPPEIEVLPAAQVAEAQARVAAGHVRGKLVLDLASPGVWGG
jgi:NADPH:quinone reductase-like Zn-dependent oxidoreductase